MLMARVENDTIIEQRELDPLLVPPHKLAFWRPIEGDPPTVDRHLYDVTGPVYQIEPARVLRVWTITPRDLATVKAEAKRRIGHVAEQSRSKYVTPGSGKAMSYQQVVEEARTHVATGGVGDYPFLGARVLSGRYPDLAAAAAGTIEIARQWSVIGAEIDRLEDVAKRAIGAATTLEQVQTAEQVTWP